MLDGTLMCCEKEDVASLNTVFVNPARHSVCVTLELVEKEMI